tara:strand:- start:5 stop:778 length:774 start_codon:yes stop_codon:yes gene_type:complete
MSYKEIKSNFENTFVDQLKAYNHSTLTGLEEFKHVDSIIGCTQYIDTLYQSQPKNIYVLPNEYHYHHSLKMNNIIEPEALPDNGHVLMSVPNFNNAGLPEHFEKVLNVATQRNCSVHLDLAWWTISRGLTLDLRSPCIKTVATSLGKPFSILKNRIGIRLRKSEVTDAVTVQNGMNNIPESLFKIGLSYLQQHSLGYMWDTYGESYDELCRTAKLRPTPIYFIAGLFGQGNKHINLALKEFYANWCARHDSNMRPSV